MTKIEYYFYSSVAGDKRHTVKEPTDLESEVGRLVTGLGSITGTSQFLSYLVACGLRVWITMPGRPQKQFSSTSLGV